MNILFKNIDELKGCIRIQQKNFDFASFKSYIELAQQKYLPKYLSQDFLDEIVAFYNQETPDTEDPLYTLLPYVQRVLANFSYQLAIPDLDVELTASGFAVIQNQNLVPASSDRVKNFMSNREKLSYEWIEQMLRFLEENQDDYDTWKNSTAFTYNYNLLIHNATIFNEFVNIDESRLQYSKWYQSMKNIEKFLIEPAISKDLADQIRTQIKENNLSDNNKLILPSIQSALAYITSGQNWKDDKMELMGRQYLTDVKKTMDANPDNYPLYRDSDSYIEGRTDYSTYANKGSFFLMGGGHSQ